MKNGTDIQSQYRVSFRPLLRLLLWPLALTSLTSAQNVFEFSPELARFLPECASNCFVSFLNSHFSQISCDQSKLGCLCTRRGAAGFVIGEGAVQCIEAEQRIGLCRSEAIRSDAVQSAYFMCSGQRGAVQPTHTALEATFVRTGTAGGVILAPPATEPPSSSTTLTTSTKPLPTTLVTATGSLTFSPSVRPTETESETSSPTSSSQSTSTAEPEESQAASTEEPSGSGFGTSQVIGLAVGVSGALGLLLAAFLLARCRRRKRLDAAGPFMASEKRDSPGRHRGRDHGKVVHISPPIPGPSPAFGPPGRARGTMWPDTIGAALSRPGSGARSNISSPHYRRASKLLPPRPTASRPFLTLDIPDMKLSASPPDRTEAVPPADVATQAQAQPRADMPNQPAPVRRPGRESTMTEFEEDDILSAASQSVSQIWRPPHSDPRSATTYYVADASGNWVLGRPDLPGQASAAVELDGSPAVRTGPVVPVINATKASEVGIGHGKGSPVAPAAPQGPSRPAPTTTVLLPAANIATAGRKPVSASSSTYSAEKAGQNARFIASTAHNVPAMSFSHPDPPRRRSNSLNNRRTHQRGDSHDGPARYDSYKSHGSKESVTTLASSVGDDDEPGRILDQANLSPVVESPEVMIETTQAPRMHGLGLRDDTRLLYRPPPVRPGHVSPVQPSPVMGGSQGYGVPSFDQQYRSMGANVPPRHHPSMAQPHRREYDESKMRRPDPSQFKTGSPSLPTMRVVPPDLTASLVSPYPSPLRPQRPSMHGAPAPYSERPPPRAYTQPERSGPSTGGQTQYQAYRPQAVGIHQALWGQRPPGSEWHEAPRQQAGWRPQPSRQAHPEDDLSQLQNQLRRPQFQQGGPYPQHIATQQARPSMPSGHSNHSGGSSSWSSSSSSLAAKRIGSERAAALAVQTGGGRGHDAQWRSRNGEGQRGGGPSDENRSLALPQTPGWQPRLTPTRRGDDLFLHLQ